MIAKLTGVLDSVSISSVIIDVNGVGYLVNASARTLSKLGGAGEAISLLIDTKIREDAFDLFGFVDQGEQAWFRLLISVQGVGAKAALAILSVTPPDQLGFAIASGDKTALTRADGVGPKLASRILTELKDKVDKIELGAAKSSSSSSASEVSGSSISDIDQDAVSALVNLGYSRSDAYRAVMNAKQKANDNSKVNDLIKIALKELSI